MHEYLQIIGLAAACVGFIVLYGTYRCKAENFTDPLTTKFAPAPYDQFFDGWGITHFLFFMTLAYMYPTKNALILIWFLGVGWEVVESIFHDHPFYISKCNYKLTTDDVSGWWYGRWQDIIMNSAGMLLGVYLTKGNLAPVAKIFS
jgi:hypothetical protein